MADSRESELHNDIREGVRLVCRDFPDSYWRDLDERHEFPWEFYKALAEGGWVGIAIPEQYGGGGCGIAEASLVLEEGSSFWGGHEWVQRARYWREARLMRIAPVPQEMILNYLAERVLGLPRSYGRPLTRAQLQSGDPHRAQARREATVGLDDGAGHRTGVRLRGEVDVGPRVHRRVRVVVQRRYSPIRVRNSCRRSGEQRDVLQSQRAQAA